MASKPQPSDQRREPRVPTSCRASARIALSVDILDGSRMGVRVRSAIALPIGTTLKIGLPGGTERHAKVAWTDGDVFGCEFLAPLKPGELSLLLDAPQRGH